MSPLRCRQSATPRDRNSTQLVKKHQTTLSDEIARKRIRLTGCPSADTQLN
ncbi:hypothetical protein [Izhakiella australiensis]|uniref:hypothetical protein n=1 Tax=Izhakiella australiensis TaxID=1926881 RepID=UPI0015901AC8|nr:hypothetical protein [Izhakiella australiensis]